MRWLLRRLTRRNSLSDPRSRYRPSHSLSTVRLGSVYGGWEVPEGLQYDGLICYCAGAGEDVSFDMALVARGALVWIIDPTPRARDHFRELSEAMKRGESYPVNRDESVRYEAIADGLDRASFLPVGLWRERGTVMFHAPRDPSHVSHSIVNLQDTDAGFEADVTRLSSLMEELGHHRIGLLKLDIEGAEYAVLESMLEDGLDVEIVCVEYDEWPMRESPGARERIDASVGKMRRAGYDLVEIDAACNALFIRNDVVARIRENA